MFGIAGLRSLHNCCKRNASETPEKIAKIIGNVLTLRTILVLSMMLLAVIGAFTISTYNYSGSMIPYGVLIASISTVFAIINGTLTSVLQANYQMRKATIATILGRIIIVAVMLYTVFFGFPENIDSGFYWLVAAGTIGNFFTLIYTQRQVKKITEIQYRFDLPFWKKILKESLPYGIALILNTIYFRVDSLLIQGIRGDVELGLYAPAMKTLEQLAIIPLYFMNTVLPILTKAIKEKKHQYKAIIRHSFDFLAAISVPMVIGGFILAYPIVFAISSPEYLSRISEGFYGTDFALKILIFAVFFQFINVLFAFILIAKNQQYKLLYINAFGVIFNVVSNFILIPKYGFLAAACTSVASEFIILVLTYVTAKRSIQFKLSVLNLFKILFSGAVMGFAVYYLQAPTYSLLENWNLLVLVPIGAVIYAIMLFATKTVDRSMLSLLKKQPNQEIL